MPVVATTESGRELARRCHVRVAVQDMADLVWVFFMHASERELGKALGGFFIEGGCRRIFGGDANRRQQNQSDEENSHRRNVNRNGAEWRLQALGSARVSRVGFGVSPEQAFLRIPLKESFRTWQEKSAIARRARQHARRVRYPEIDARLLCVSKQTNFRVSQILHMSFSIRSSSLRICALLAAMQIAAIATAAEKNSSSMPAENPFLTESSLPYHLPPFDKIKDEQFVPATESGMQEQLKEVDAIAANAGKASFENTVVALERTGQLLDRVQRTFSNLNAADTNPTRQKIETELAPKLSAHHDAILLNSKLFARVQELYSNREKLGLDPESAYLLERYYKDFVRAGAKLSDPDKEKLKKINAELATLQTRFDQNVLKEKNASSVVVDKKEDLAGLSDSQMATVTSAAKAEHKDGKFVIQMQNTTGQPLLGSLQNRPLRQRIMDTSLGRNSHGGEFDTQKTVLRTAQLRAEKAKLLGYPNWAAYQLEDQTAHNVPTVNKILGDLAPAAVTNAKAEAAEQ